MTYNLRWDYSDLESDQLPDDPERFDIFFSFHLRFPAIPPGKGHAAHFCFRVLSPAAAKEEGLASKKRGVIIADVFSYSNIIADVEKTLAEAFSQDHAKALEYLNTLYINADLDFSNEFIADVRDSQFVEEALQKAFSKSARSDLPAQMTSAFKTGEFREPYESLLPLVAPREVGRGFGEKFDVAAVIREHSFSPEQVKAVYSFLIYAAVKGKIGVEEDHYPALLKWRKAAMGTGRGQITRGNT